MKYTRKNYEDFLNAELQAQIQGYEQIANTEAVVLKKRGDVFVGQFIKLQDNGMAIFKVRHSDDMPRKNSFWTASYFINEMNKYRNWGNLSWAELRKKFQRAHSDALCVWIQQTDEQDFCLVGIKNITTEFAQLLVSEKPLIAFGPKDPPLQYLLNLIEITRDSTCKNIQPVLDFNESGIQWNPQKIDSKCNLTSLLEDELRNRSNYVVVQGPPGTGKTYRMAQMAAHLLDENRSVLATALTNQALMELAKKNDMQSFLEQGKVSKTSLTVDENKELPRLLPIKDNLCNASKGNLSLATFYVASGWAKDAEEQPFDYVIMDESSQALLPMIAASARLGKKVILIGDQNQLPPIVTINEDVINRNHWSPMIRGFETICQHFPFKSYMLSDTFRQTQRGAESTGIFYQNLLHSVSETQTVPSKLDFLNKQGGPIFKGLDLKIGQKAPINALECIFDYVSNMLTENNKATIAVLSKFRETVRATQKHFILKWQKTKALPDNLLIETVDRVQGLTVDYCIFFIPNSSLQYSLENELFNVATSRAKYNTIIVADQTILRQGMSEEVRKFILKSQEDKFVAFEAQNIPTEAASVNKARIIKLAEPESNKPERPTAKQYTYVIDTNVFVNCPDIIARIGRHHKIVIPAKVLEELDKLKLKPSIDISKLSLAVKNIGSAFTNQYSSMEDADTSLIPSGFDKNNPDCMILSVALKHKNEQAVLLTSDNLLQTRAKGLGIATVSLQQFLRK